MFGISKLSCAFLSFVVLFCVGKQQYSQLFHDIAVKTYQSDNKSLAHSFQIIHLIRVPKASSTSLSTVSRRMVGCSPSGPCCKWPGDPPGSCPSKELFNCQTEGKVIGCTHHHPNYDSLLNSNIASFTMIREPMRRSISAFFYPGIHHNSKCTKDRDTCFKEYTSSSKWSNVVIKMLTGLYAYSPDKVCQFSRDCKHSLELAIRNLDRLHFIGVAEMWELSMLVLHSGTPSLTPLLEEFAMADGKLGSHFNQSSQYVVSYKALTSNLKLSAINSTSSSSDVYNTKQHSRSLLTAARKNEDLDYITFRSSAPIVYRQQLIKQNSLDLMLYDIVVDRFCDELHRLGLWTKEPLIAEYWLERSPRKTKKCP